MGGWGDYCHSDNNKMSDMCIDSVCGYQYLYTGTIPKKRDETLTKNNIHVLNINVGLTN